MAEHWTPTPGGFQPGASNPEPDTGDPMAEEQLGLFPPLTAKEFDDGCGYVVNGIPLCEDEDGQYVYAYGHIYRRDFAEAVTAYDREMAGYDVDAASPQDVENVWAVTILPADDPDGWRIRWGGVTKDTPNAFAMTVVTR